MAAGVVADKGREWWAKVRNVTGFEELQEEEPVQASLLNQFNDATTLNKTQVPPPPPSHVRIGTTFQPPPSSSPSPSPFHFPSISTPTSTSTTTSSVTSTFNLALTFTPYQTMHPPIVDTRHSNAAFLQLDG